jgi:hypothetical protein
MKLQKVLNPFITHSLIKCIDNTYIQTGVSTPDLFFTATNQHYYNLSNLAVLTDFIEVVDMYRYFRLRKVDFVFERVVDEATMYARTSASPIFINYDPTMESITVPYSTVSRDQSAYKLDMMTFEPQMVT